MKTGLKTRAYYSIDIQFLVCDGGLYETHAYQPFPESPND